MGKPSRWPRQVIPPIKSQWHGDFHKW
uniref:Uncharacterized protein n=1 Tax=Vitis vinifera TaxID=29760 RepID=F6HT32_VITVI